jgi:hypothetical protein
MKSAKLTKRTGSRPVGTGRSESAGRVGRRKPFVYERSESQYTDTGVFHTSRPKVVGVSDEVRIANRNLARRASREMARWSRTLPKGVKV